LTINTSTIVFIGGINGGTNEGKSSDGIHNKQRVISTPMTWKKRNNFIIEKEWQLRYLYLHVLQYPFIGNQLKYKHMFGPNVLKL
jgi:hypothetical protein